LNFFRGLEYDPTVDWDAMMKERQCGQLVLDERQVEKRRCSLDAFYTEQLLFYFRRLL
jgi:hypothetical protein